MALRDEILAKFPALTAATRDDGAIAVAVSTGRTAVVDYWLTDRGLVSDLANATGNETVSDSVLTKLDAAALQSRSAKALINRLENDPKGVNFGDSALRTWIQNGGVFSASEISALLALPVKPAPVSALDVAQALEGYF